VKESIALEVRTAYLNLQDAAKRLEVARKGLEQATEALRLARVRYEAGVSLQLEISDAELAYTQAQTNLVTAQFDYLDAYAALQKAVGTIGARYALVSHIPRPTRRPYLFRRRFTMRRFDSPQVVLFCTFHDGTQPSAERLSG
jgi:hypothetical protein